MSRISRRAVLSTTGRAAAALVATLSLGGLAVAATAEPDPIFAAIEEHKAIRARWTAFCDGPRLPPDEDNAKMDELCDADAHAAWAMLDIEPTTVAGVAALLAYVAEHRRQGHSWPERQVIPETDISPEYLAAHPGRRFFDAVHLENDAIALAARALQRLTGGQANG